MTRPRLMFAAVATLLLVAGACTDDTTTPDATTTTSGSLVGPAGPPAVDVDTIAPSITSGLEQVGAPLSITKCESTGKPVKDLPGAKPATGKVPQDTFTIAENDADHVEDCVDYDARPPVGGDHFAIWVNCGLYYDRVPDMMGVHVLEHGAVWITYSPQLPGTDLAAIATAVKATTHLLASPYPDLPSPIVMSAWGVQLQLDSTTDARFAAFLAHYIQGPQTREMGASCSGAVGQPDVPALAR